MYAGSSRWEGTTLMRVVGALRNVGPDTALSGVEMPPKPMHLEPTGEVTQWGPEEKKQDPRYRPIPGGAFGPGAREEAEREAFLGGLIECKRSD